MEDDEDLYYADDSTSSTASTYSDSSPDDRNTTKFYVTKESQDNLTEPAKKLSYVGVRDLSDLDKIQEQDIVATDGSVRGVRNRVRAGLANFENREVLEKVSLFCQHEKGGWG